MNIYLIGYRGTGKTTLGRALGTELKHQFVDIDELIVEKSGMTIPQIFEKQGEGRFRDIKSEMLNGISKEQNLVVATGGGIIEREENRKILKNSGMIIYLKASADVIYQRIGGDTNRPALTQKSEKDEITHMLDKRKLIYEDLANYTLDTESHNLQECLNLIVPFILKKEGYA